jgi:hypothetical protein
MASKTLEGGCGCGAVCYRHNDESIFVNNCQCTLCQRQTGTGWAVNAFSEMDKLELLSDELSKHEFKRGEVTQIIVCCAKRGTPARSRYQLGAVVGTLDEPSAVQLDAAIYVADQLGWSPLPGGVPQFEAFYAPAELRRPNRFAQLQVLLQQ